MLQVGGISISEEGLWETGREVGNTELHHYRRHISLHSLSSLAL